MSKRFRTFDEDRRVLPKLGKPSRFESTPHSRERVTRPLPSRDAWDVEVLEEPSTPSPSGLKAAELDYLKRELAGETPAVENTIISFSTTSIPSFSQSWVFSHIQDPRLKNQLRFYLATRPYYPSPISLSEEWIAFAEKEVSFTQGPMSELVAPSGDFSANCPLYTQYHYPTFFTSRQQWGFSADNTNACTRMTLKKGLNPLTQPIVQGEVFWRRESTKGSSGKKHPYQKMNHQDVLDLHDTFSKKMYQIVNPLVVLVFGRAAENKLLDTYATGCDVGLLEIPSFQPQGSGDRNIRLYIIMRMGTICRVAVASPHPEAVFRPQRHRCIDRHIDECVQLAVELAGLEIPINTNYFEWKENWRWHKTEMGWEEDASENLPRCITQMARYENVSAEEDAPIEAVDFESFPKEVRRVFTEWTGKPATEDEMNVSLVPLCPEPHKTLARGLHILMLKLSGTPEPTLGYPGLSGGGNKGLVYGRPKGLETRAADDFPELAAGRKTQEEERWSGLEKARAELARRKAEGLDPRVGSHGKTEKQTSFPCPEDACTKLAYNTKQALRLHIQVDHQGKRWVCEWPHCLKEYRNSGNLSSHTKRNHNGVRRPPGGLRPQ